MADVNGKITALYCRLSAEDGYDSGESGSIANQKETLTRYCNERGFTNIKYFVDDGTSGTVFRRTGLDAMLAEVKAGNVATVIFKDQSRIGRDVLEVGLLKRTFEQYNVRYIAANDNLDSANGFDIMSVFRDVINEYYVADASKKARNSKRLCATQGKTISRPPYGYSPTKDKSVWVINEFAAEIVREVFKRIIAGENTHSIARSLNERNIPTPNNYWQTERGTTPKKKSPWSSRTIQHMIDSQTYIGTYIASKHTTPSYKNHKRIIRDESEWVVIKNHHPALIDIETYETATRLRNARRRITKRGDRSILSGLLFCADCDAKLTLSHNKYDYYICSNYRVNAFYTDKQCTRHGVRREDAEEIALATIRKTINLAVTDKVKFAAQVNKIANKDSDKVAKTKTNELGKSERRIAELDKLIAKLCEDHVTELLSAERFKKVLDGYEDEQARLNVTAATLRAELEDLKKKTANVESFIKLAEQYAQVTELTAELARTFIEKIVVHAPVYENANRRSKKSQEIHVYLAYIGEFSGIE